MNDQMQSCATRKTRQTKAERLFERRNASFNYEVLQKYIGDGGMKKACELGIWTCTRGEPGEIGSMYASAWHPLPKYGRYSPEVRARHAENMLRVVRLLEPKGRA